MGRALGSHKRADCPVDAEDCRRRGTLGLGRRSPMQLNFSLVSIWILMNLASFSNPPTMFLVFREMISGTEDNALNVR